MANKVTKNQCIYQNLGDNSSNVQWMSLPSEKNLEVKESQKLPIGGALPPSLFRGQRMSSNQEISVVNKAQPAAGPERTDHAPNLAPFIPIKKTVDIPKPAKSPVTFTPQIHPSASSDIPPHIRRKLNWFIDQDALIHKDKFKDILNMLMTYSRDTEGGSQLQSALL